MIRQEQGEVCQSKVNKQRVDLYLVVKGERLDSILPCFGSPAQRELEIEVLPTLSTANVRELSRADLPLPELSLDQARSHIAQHLVNHSRSKASRLRHRAKNHAPA